MFVQSSSAKLSLFIFFLVLLTLLLLIAVYVQRRDNVRIDTFAVTDYSNISEKDELVLVQSWISDRSLNQYGDALDSVYAAGEPLLLSYDGYEKTLLEYVRERHPSEPWLK